MKNLKFIHIADMTGPMIFTACDKDEDPSTSGGCLNTSWHEQTKAETKAVSDAAITFSTAPSKGTCESFRAAYIDYVEALEKLVPCVPTENRQAFDVAQEEGKTELANLDCNQDFQ